MYEVEVDHARLTSDALPPDVRSRFLQPRSATHIGHIKWEEHCTECTYPKCYATCDFYNPRSDNHCRRTIDGFAPLADMPVFANRVVRVRFKRGGTLTAHCHLALRRVEKVTRTERRFNALAGLAAAVPRLGASIGWPGLPSRVVRVLKRRSVDTAPRTGEDTREPNCFVIEVYNPSSRTVELSLDIAARSEHAQQITYRRLLEVEPGYQCLRIAFDEISPRLGVAREVTVAVNPNLVRVEDEGLTLFFGVMNFAHDPTFRTAIAGAEKKVKVVVWDLDNTVWDGTLIEDGPGRVRLKPGMREVIQGLDRRGIVNSVASKNDESTALAELERFGLREYFVFPMIGWGPKSEALRHIVRSFNVGEDTVAFIDDQAFEREEVRAGNPQVRTYTQDQYLGLLARSEFDMPVTDEARSRRLFYQSEAVRQHAREEIGGDYLAFLQQSGMCIHIAPATADLIDRTHELVQRTNQMNFSGTRHSRQDLLALVTRENLECFLIDAQDNYGRYGHIGFAVVSGGCTPRVIDLAFSCRVQAKRVEHAVLIFLMNRYASRGARDFEVVFRLSQKNRQVAQVFSDLGFSEVQRNGDDFVYGRNIASGLPADPIVTVRSSMPDTDFLFA